MDLSESRRKIVLMAVIFWGATARCEDRPCNLNCSATDPTKLNLHLICHSHQDVGWVYTIEEYYRQQVQQILRSVVLSLSRHPRRKFIYAEVAFLSRWFESQPTHVKSMVQRLVQEGRLQLVGGGWTMSDEAVTHYSALVDQMTLGLAWIKKTFGRCARPRVAWQIDPFGHSKFHASMFSQMHYDGVFLGRIDYQDKEWRQTHRKMEFLWRNRDENGQGESIFTSVLPNVYWPPPGFCFDILCNPIMEITNSNVESRAALLIKLARKQARQYRTNHVIMTMGMDFYYQDAERWYRNLDRLMDYINGQANGQVRVIYSTPACYVQAVNAVPNVTWPTEDNDFFPYASGPHEYWTGYYTSRPSLKYLTRRSNALLQACKQLSAMAHLEPERFRSLKVGLAIMQHHDAITGTEKQYVANNYSRILHNGIEDCKGAISEAFLKLVGRNSDLGSVDFCWSLNVSQCNVSESGGQFRVAIYNPLAHEVSTYVRVPVSSPGVQCTNSRGMAIPVQVVPIPESVVRLAWRRSTSTEEAVIPVILPPLGFESYQFTTKYDWLPIPDPESDFFNEATSDITIENEYLRIAVDADTGLIKAVSLEGGRTVELRQTFVWYEATPAFLAERASGAYAFNPVRDDPLPLDDQATFRVVRGSLVQEIHQRFTPWLSQTVRLSRWDRHLELDWTVGPLPPGTELVSRFLAPGLNHSGVFHTDNNGRAGAPRRVRNFRPSWPLNVTEHISANYYPATSWAYIEDDSLQLAVLTDRPQGVCSPEDGILEFMLHRRLLWDDEYGVDEPLNELGEDGLGLVVRGTHWVLLGPREETTGFRTALAQKIFHRPVLLFSAGRDTETTQFPMQLSGGLPPSLHLMTLEPLDSRRLLVRVEHLFLPGTPLGEPASFNMKRLLPLFSINMTREVVLSADFSTAELGPKLRWTAEDELDFEEEEITYMQDEWEPHQDIVVQPNTIRTFIVSHSA